jgi:hypothetical protein
MVERVRNTMEEREREREGERETDRQMITLACPNCMSVFYVEC